MLAITPRLRAASAGCSFVLQCRTATHSSWRHPHGLAQAIGYLKYTGGSSSEQILFRGQAAIYPRMLPSIYRPSTRLPAVRKERADEEVNSFLRECQRVEPFIRGTPRESFEPLLQHYGMRTRWLDVVDNIWVALWFACHDIVVDGVERQYWSIERRSRSRGGAFAYIVLFAFRNPSEHRALPGHVRGPNYRIVDLRVAAPSLYFRPHAQHGLLFRRSGQPATPWEDLSDLVAGVLRMDIADALDWLGTGEFLGVQTLFPSPVYDQGYRLLLRKVPTASDYLSSVAYVGP